MIHRVAAEMQQGEHFGVRKSRNARNVRPFKIKNLPGRGSKITWPFWRKWASALKLSAGAEKKTLSRF
jgi:hypothetical protein